METYSATAIAQKIGCSEKNVYVKLRHAPYVPMRSKVGRPKKTWLLKDLPHEWRMALQGKELPLEELKKENPKYITPRRMKLENKNAHLPLGERLKKMYFEQLEYMELLLPYERDERKIETFKKMGDMLSTYSEVKKLIDSIDDGAEKEQPEEDQEGKAEKKDHVIDAETIKALREQFGL